MEETEPEIWSAVDDYFAAHLAPGDPALDGALRANAAAGLPAIDVSPLQGRFLELLARAVGPGGRVVTLEADAGHAEVARANVARAALDDRVELRVGRALDTLPTLQGDPPFDLVFIDADKPSNPDYLAWALRLSRPGTVIVADNVVRGGRVVDGSSPDANVRGVRRFTELVAAEPRLDATALQTVGAKGYDGFVLAVVTR